MAISRNRLRVLQIEDDVVDAELIQATLKEEDLDFDFLRVDNEAALVKALQSQSFDLVLADYRLPSLTGASSLKIVRDFAPDLPFILVSGTVGEEVAVETLKLGATDFVLKGSLGRLALAVRRAVEESNKIKGLRQTELALRESEEKYRNLVERIPAIVYIAEAGRYGRWHYVSPRIKSILGFTPEEWLNNPELWFEQILDEDRAHAVSSDDKFHDVFTTEYRMRTKSGNVVWFRDEAISLKSEHGGKLVQGVMIDITDLKEAEQAKLSIEEKLRQIQKVEVVGQLAGGVAHDFNNILMVIASYCEILQMKIPIDDPNWTLIHEIKVAADRGSSLTRQLLAISRRQKVEPRVVDLNLIIAEMQQMIRHLIRENIDLRIDLYRAALPVKVDPGQIERLIINLVVNARDAMPSSGILYIGTEIFSGADPSEMYARLTITDTGSGMDQETIVHIFEPFFSTKEEGKGTGLGLATTKAIVSENGGQIEVTSEPGKGSTFRVLFPLLTS